MQIFFGSLKCDVLSWNRTGCLKWRKMLLFVQDLDLVANAVRFQSRLTFFDGDLDRCLRYIKNLIVGEMSCVEISGKQKLKVGSTVLIFYVHSTCNQGCSCRMSWGTLLAHFLITSIRSTCNARASDRGKNISVMIISQLLSKAFKYNISKITSRCCT